MATPSVADVLAQPGIAAQIDAFTELLPGVPADEKHLKAVLAALKETGIVNLGELRRFPGLTPDTPPCTLPRVVLQYVHRRPTKRNPGGTGEIDVDVQGAEERAGTPYRPFWYRKHFPATTAGLVDAIAFAKETLARYRRGWCPECEAAEPPRKRLKADHLPICTGCVIGGAIGLKVSSNS